MGVDLSTNGAVGIPVHAAANGHVSRVRCSPWGYGKAVYIQFDDGCTAVYGHLSDFRQDLRDFVRAEQHRRTSYTVELQPAPDQFPVRKGEVIAFSGDTGIGPAHLHFELRDASGRPVNPRLLGLNWPDKTPPVFNAVMVAPRDPSSRVDGDILPVVRKAERGKTGVWTCPSVRVRGDFAFAVDLVDPTPAGNRLGIHEARLIAPDGSTVFEVRHDTIAYSEHGAAFAYHPAFSDEGHFLLLWRWPGNAAASDAVSAGEGWCHAPAESCHYHIELADFMGNTAKLDLPVTQDEGKDEGAAPPASVQTAADAKDGTVKLDAPGTFLVTTASFPTPETRAPTLTIDGKPSGAKFFAVGKRTFRAAWEPAKRGRRVMIGAVHPRLSAEPVAVETVASGESRTIQWDGGPRLRLAAGAACGPLCLRAEILAAEPASPVSARGAPWRLWPDTAPLALPVELTLPLPETVRVASHAAIARRNGNGWSWLKTTRDGGMCTAQTDELGDFQVMEDDQAPRELEFTPGPATPVTSSRPRIHASVSDAGSGIADWSLHCDGKWLLSAYDPEAGRVTWERDEELSSGEHEIVLALTDGAGNISTSKHLVMVLEK